MHKLSKFILMFGLFILILWAFSILGTIQYYYPLDMTAADNAHWAKLYATERALHPPCTLEKCSKPWKVGLPEGKLVIIIPKTITVGDNINTYCIGFAYSPVTYSNDEISQITQKYLEELRLNEDKAHIVELDVLMGTRGHPSITNSQLHFIGDSSYITPDRLTEWKVKLHSGEAVEGGMENIGVNFVYQEQVGMCKAFCASVGKPYLELSESVKVQIKYPISARIHNIGTKIDNFWSRLIRNYWFVEPIVYYLLLVLVVFVFEIVRKVRNQQSPE